MRSTIFAAVILATGCGRIGFDPVSSGGDDVDGQTVGEGGLVAWWKLDETSGTSVADANGNLTGTYVGGAPTWTTGKIGGALELVGNGDHVALGQPALLANLPPVTVTAWIDPIAFVDDGVARCIFDKASPVAGWAFLIDSNGLGSIGFAGYFESGDRSERDSHPGRLTAGQWTHVAGTWDGGSSSGGVHIYVDGAEITYMIAKGGLPTRPDDSAIPASINCSAGPGMAGLIDDVRVFDRVLTEAEIAAIFAS
ncbi:MAG: LamG domain-containing protein [Kofleriaceae bacterium]